MIGVLAFHLSLDFNRYLTPDADKTVATAIDGRLMIRRIKQRGQRMVLKSEDHAASKYEITADSNITIWGVAKHVTHASNVLAAS